MRGRCRSSRYKDVRNRTGEDDRYKMISHLPHVIPLIVEAELEIPEAVDRRLSGNGADDRTNSILQS